MGRAIGTNEYDNPVGANHPFRRLDGHVRVLDVNPNNQFNRSAEQPAAAVDFVYRDPGRIRIGSTVSGGKKTDPYGILRRRVLCLGTTRGKKQ